MVYKMGGLFGIEQCRMLAIVRETSDYILRMKIFNFLLVPKL